MNPKLEKTRDNFIEAAGQLSASLGLSRVAGQLYGLLYLNDGSLSLDEMVKILNISKGNVSVNIRELEKWGAARKVWVKGSRKDYYEAELDVLKIVVSRLKDGLQRRVNDAVDLIDKTTGDINNGENGFTPKEKKTVKVYTERLNNIKELHNLVNSFLDNMSQMV